MKRNLPVFAALLFICFSMFFFQGCMKDKLTKTYSIFIPVYKEKNEVYANIKSNAPAVIQQPGKIFLYGNYIFLNEIDKGVHIIDNSNPANPVVKAFINIPGNLDIAVKGNTLYADLYTDLVVVDISDPLQASFVKYVPHVFPERNYTNGFRADSNRIIVDWIKKDTTVDINTVCNSCSPAQLADFGGGPRGAGNAGPSGGPVGIAGSMARFSIVNNYLYTVNKSALTSFNISITNDPVRTATQQVTSNIETIYPFSNKLFIGSMTGMFIYDISNPATPVAQGQFAHARRCDPVIADGNYAYVTLRNGTACTGSTNQLDVVNITNINAPTLAKTYLMTNPHGLAKDNNVLFICDGKDGLKVYDAADPLNILLKKRVTGIETFDAIAWNNNLLVVAKDGLYQYDYSDPVNLVQRSKLTVNR
ncbi:MAG TPA: hypothetical protein VK483_08655 [Chitinophagaceae bacterium]|nr:hypothetical protein [Chitinophagaceae bacterium]